MKQLHSMTFDFSSFNFAFITILVISNERANCVFKSVSAKKAIFVNSLKSVVCNLEACPPAGQVSVRLANRKSFSAK